jgi:hypothetical protein
VVYTIDQARAVATQIEKLSTVYVHQLVGHFANFDFWLNEAAHALHVVDDYGARFELLRDAQKAWVDAHQTRVSEFCPICHGKCEFEPDEGKRPDPPTRIPHNQLEQARRAVKDAVYHFALRFYRAGMLDETALRAACERVSTSVDAADLKAQR